MSTYVRVIQCYQLHTLSKSETMHTSKIRWRLLNVLWRAVKASNTICKMGSIARLRFLVKTNLQKSSTHAIPVTTYPKGRNEHHCALARKCLLRWTGQNIARCPDESGARSVWLKMAQEQRQPPMCRNPSTHPLEPWIKSCYSKSKFATLSFSPRRERLSFQI